ncbi:MKRN2 opposite strand protein isoform X1 [Ornithorhynchus anatinus]|uniref:MKRN2 opposite strand n=1 Tax=Ornithorhynchus anatinus TaxID=9258 RepID=A0A6I8N488_ORNAN|nr:MKRN2 opposite strand protein isoform X1 [Ornithorhynchus anatinus]
MQPPAAGSPLVRFGHCGKAIYCFSVPRSCPLCGLGVGSPKLEDAPTSISSPFADGHRQRCAFLLRPTEGTFLRDYNGSSDLHVGITSTNGIVYNYNEKGVCRDGTGWEQSVSVPLVQPDLYGLLDRWNGYLEEFSATDDWLADRYSEDQHNCYSYALKFINWMLTLEGRQPLKRNEFIEQFVVPKTRKASKFITLYQAIEDHHFYITDHPGRQATPP